MMGKIAIPKIQQNSLERSLLDFYISQGTTCKSIQNLLHHKRFQRAFIFHLIYIAASALSLLNNVPSTPSYLTCLRVLRAFVSSRLTSFPALRAFALYVPLHLTCLHALRASIFVRLNYEPCAPYFLTRHISNAPLNVTNSLIKGNYKMF